MKLFKATLIGLACGSALAGAAQAGGFSRGEADTDILFEDGTMAGRAVVTYVSPQRGYDTISGVDGTDDDFTGNFAIPSVAAKFRFSDNFSCALTYTQPFGAKSEYGSQAQDADRAGDRASVAAYAPYSDIANPASPSYNPSSPAFQAGTGYNLYNLWSNGNAVKKASFDSNEFGGTCAANFEAGKGQFYIIGGLFLQSFDYTEVKDFGKLHLKDDGSLGYRIGAAYEIKEYALRAQLMYRSEVEQKADGDYSPGLASLANIGYNLGSDYSASGAGTLPQSLELSLQTGVAPGWLVFGSAKWTDWSVLQTLNYNIDGAFGDQEKNFFWRDGWTISGGVGHKFTDTVGGAISLTWDRGVSTGADINTDTWTIGAGLQADVGPGQLRFGGAVSYLTSGSQSVAKGADFDATVDGDWAYAVNASYRIAF
ncbi:OmpP1/FadL family transporter [Rhizobium halophytocola]|uniref:Long-chain fatty acid transport protein n=1 Tax=Rhizobium halophytocola TaxID=735519 RepID=A0ABS4DVX0_9HYPH|nr:outer membrane protein transport protein [Rhizobium halophytocola]MBP1849846.1 long-chain fatty acid transport protein [Rhizobium halophytocola]